MGSVADVIWHGLRDAFLMGWAVWWALVLGFFISAVVQAWVPHERVETALAGDGVRPVVTATGLGAASSSCSYAAVAIGKSLFQKGHLPQVLRNPVRAAHHRAHVRDDGWRRAHRQCPLQRAWAHPRGPPSHPQDIFGSVSLNYKLVLNIVGVAIFAALFWLTARQGATDPVCGMRVDRSKAVTTSSGNGTVHFCSAHCLHAFESDPGKYVGEHVRSEGGAAEHHSARRHDRSRRIAVGRRIKRG
jgi:YHS domain-containing protein